MVVTCFILLLINYIAAQHTTYTVVNDRIVDEYSRESFFHGVNIVYKIHPYLPPTDKFTNDSFSEEDMKILNSLGQNIIRLGVLWVGTEPNKTEYNLTYIQAATDIISTSYDSYNISTLIDSHQDVYSEAFCADGYPIWACQPIRWNFPEPLSPAYNDTVNHIPTSQDCRQHPWASYYTTFDTCESFQRLYDNYNGLRDSFTSYWQLLSNKFKNVDGIVGFELMNEPWVGNMYENPLLMYPGVADKINLQPFYDKVAPVIHQVDNERIVFFESVTWTDEFNDTWDEAGFDHVPGGDIYSNKSVFSFHYYDDSPNIGSENKYFSKRTSDGIRWNSTSMLTEFSIINNGQSEGKYKQMMKTMDFCDEYFVSWIGWTFKGFGGNANAYGGDTLLINGSVNPMVGASLSRTYAQKVAGHVLQMKFNWSEQPKGNFTLIYEMNTNIYNQPTIIYKSDKYWYPNGFTLDIETENKNEAIANYNVYDNYVEIYNSKDSKFNGQQVTVTIVPK
eukprot:133969_1